MSLRVVHIIPNLKKGGAERLCLDICNELHKNQDIELLLINFHVDNAYSFLTENLNRKVVSSFVIPSIIGKTICNTTDLKKIIEEFNPDVIHAHLFESIIVLSEVDYTHAHYVFHFHDNMPQFANFSWRTLLKKRLITNLFEKKKIESSFKKKSVTYLGISKDTIAYMNKVLPHNSKIVWLNNAIDLKRFSNTKKQQVEIPELTIVGSLVTKKGQDLAIDTIYELKKRGLVVRLNILGDGINKLNLKEQSIQLGVSENVVFHGNVDYPETFFARTLVYLHTAIYEPFGLVLVEAMACGLPVVCTDGKGNRDLIKDGETGFMVWERDASQLADKIQLLLENDDLRMEMGEKAKAFSQQFGIEEYCTKLIQIYQEN